MLISLKDIQNFRILAKDEGEPGSIKAFLIDDFEWAVRYAIVALRGRNLIIPVRAFGIPDLDQQVLQVRATVDQMEHSPTINLDQPLSREIERQLHDYYEWPYYWEADDVPNTLPGDLTAVPLIDMELEREEEEEEEERDLIPETGEAANQDFHLYSTKELFGENVYALNDEQYTGTLVDIISQDEDWNILYLVVDTGGLLSGHQVLVSPQWVREIDEAGSRIDVDLKSDTLKNSPTFTSVRDLTGDYQSRLNDYYDQK